MYFIYSMLEKHDRHWDDVSAAAFTSTMRLGIFAFLQNAASYLNIIFTTLSMPSGTLELTAVADDLLAGQGLKLLSCDVLQKLWQGYGYVCRISAMDEAQNKQSLILKYVKPPLTGQVESEGHIRKIISYEVEQHFYSDLAPQLPRDAVVAQCLASINNNGKVALLLEDLQRNFPVAGEKRGTLNKTQVHAAIKWLATFHGFWWDKTPDLRNLGFSRLPPLEEVLLQQDKGRSKNGVWLNGGYTYLATRMSEYTSLCQDGEQSEWSTSLCVPLLPRSNHSIAQLVARILSPANGILRDYETLIHGDVKVSTSTSTGTFPPQISCLQTNTYSRNEL